MPSSVVRSSQSAHSRRGSITSTLAVVCGGLIVIGCIAHFFVGGISSFFFEQGPTVDFLTAESIQATFEHAVLERGEIESSSNIEVRCQVRGRTSSGVNILEIVPEGKWVEENDFLVRLDDSSFQLQLVQQQIVCSNSEAAAIEAEANLESARLALQEYDEGTFKELLAQQQSAVFIAEENKRRAEEYITYSKRLAERGYIPEAQLEADAFSLEKSKKELGVAKTKLEVLSKFTREKMLTQLRASIKTAEAKLRSRTKTWELDKIQLADFEDQIKKCTIIAPAAGQVVYANNRSKSSSSSIIEEGLPVRERQTIINLPDPNKMQVVAKVHESRIGFVTQGQTAHLQLDAMPELPLTGLVTKVSEYPLPPISVYMAHVKEYEVVIQIDSPPADLRPGMTAEVKVLIDKIENAIQIPIEAVVERNDQYYCAVEQSDGTLDTRLLAVGLSNDTDLVVASGLSAGEKVVINIANEEVLELMKLPSEES